MNTCINEKMASFGMDWFVLVGRKSNNPSMQYFLGDGNLISPVLLKKRGGPLLLIYQSMEREEALKTGLECYDSNEILPRRSGRTEGLRAGTQNFFEALFDRFGVEGSVFLAGNEDSLRIISIYELCVRRGIEVLFPGPGDFFQLLRLIKSAGERERIGEVCRKNVKLFEEVRSFLQSTVLSSGRVLDGSGDAVTVGRLRELVFRCAARENLSFRQAPPIIAMGRDGAYPHSRGTDSMELEEGAPIVMDLSPQSLTSGYFSDMTRTLCRGRASQSLKMLYSEVKRAYDGALAVIGAGVPLNVPDIVVCELFAGNGHQTPLTASGAAEGYVHSLGHGVGLELHEMPRISASSPSGTFAGGMVFTVEPGLYYPDRRMGVRLEDMFLIDEEGALRNLTAYPMELEIL